MSDRAQYYTQTQTPAVARFRLSTGVLRVPDAGSAGDTRSGDARWLSDSGVAGVGLNRCGVLLCRAHTLCRVFSCFPGLEA